MIITLPDNYTLAAIGGICLIVVAWGVVLWRRRRKPKEKKEVVKPTISASVDSSNRIAVALEKIARGLTATGGGGDVADRAEALAKQFEASASLGISVGLPPALVAKMIRQSILQEQANEEKVQPA